MTAIGEPPASPAGARAAALELLSEGRLDEAHEALRRSLAQTVDLEAVNDLAVIAHRLGYTREAEALLRAATVIDPSRRDAIENLEALGQTVVAADPRLDQILAGVTWLARAERERAERDGTFQADVLTGMRRIHADERSHRRRVRELRRAPGYERAFTDPDPLISVIIPTYDRLELLRSRAIPSILAQDYRHFEIVIVGDLSRYDAREVTAGFEGAPISFTNLTLRGPYSENQNRRWLSSGTPPFNEALSRARGAWIAPFADDDEMRPAHLRLLIDEARERRLEFVYGRGQMHHDESGNRVIGQFPPTQGEVILQAGLLHAGLTLFELELADADFRVPNDWGMVERMMRAGVRMGMVDEILLDYYPSFSR